MLHEGQPVAYVSRALTGAETKYAQIEKELPAVLFGLERFHQFVYGREVTVESDHKPLEAILKKTPSQTPLRLQRMLLRLQKYNFHLIHKPGKKMYIADTLSRAYLPRTQKDEFEEEINCFVHSVVSNLSVSEEKLEELRVETLRDETATASTSVAGRMAETPVRSTHQPSRVLAVQE